MYSDTVTVFNKLGDSWYPHILTNVTLHKTKGANIAEVGADSADTAKLNIRYEKTGGQIRIGALLYYAPKAWKAANTPDTSITFNEAVDFFVEGEYPEGAVQDGEYRDGFYNYLKTTRDNVFLVTTVDGPFKLIPHFEVGGK